MRKSLIIVACILFTYINLTSQFYIRQDHNGWSTGNPLIQRSDLYGGSTYSTYFQANIDQEFKITNSDYSIQWGSGYWITTYNSRWTIAANGNNAIWKGSPLGYIQVNSFNPNDYIGQDIPTGIMTLSAIPISIPTVSQIGTDQGGGNFETPSVSSQTVNISLSNPKSNEENIYLRYTNDDWVTDFWVLATGSGTTFTADISGQSNNTTVKYYVLSTTLTFNSNNDLDNFPDLMTLNYNNNGGSNFSYRINTALPVSLSLFSVDVIKFVTTQV